MWDLVCFGRLSVTPDLAIRAMVNAMMPPLHAKYTASIDEPARPASALFTGTACSLA